MARAVNIYVKRTLRLDLLNIPQRKMYEIGNVALESIRERVARARGVNDAPADPLKSESWKRIKMSKGLRPIRDLHGTGMMWPQKSSGGKRKKKWALKNVGHLMDQLSVRKVTDNQAFITEPTTRPGRIKARAHREMLGLSPFNKSQISAKTGAIVTAMKSKLVKALKALTP
jgi:hypothetical protein